MEQAEGDMLFNNIRAVHWLDIGEALIFVYGYDDKRPDQLLSPNSLAHVRILHAASLIRVSDFRAAADPGGSQRAVVARWSGGQTVAVSKKRSRQQISST
jgi:hypothetical protein